MTGNAESQTEDYQCSVCGTVELVYPAKTDRGTLTNCLTCLAIRRADEMLPARFERFEDRDRDLRESGYRQAVDWHTVLARIQQDDSLVIEEPGEWDTQLSDATRHFLTELMGEDAFNRPSALQGQA